MPETRFAKMHSLGNDFVVLDGIAAGLPDLDAASVRAVADRRRGIGCDQLLLLGPVGADGAFGYRIFNADGGEVAQCGNGARCAFAYLSSRGYCGKRCTLRTAAGTIAVSQGPSGPRALLGEPRFDPAQIPLAASGRQDRYEANWRGETWQFAALSIGNPHAVFVVDDAEDAPVDELGSFLNRSDLFPERVNVGFAQPLPSRAIRLRVFERGVGETPACGSAAAAAAVALARPADLQAGIEVIANGGRLAAGWDGPGHAAWIEGAAVESFAGTADIGRLAAQSLID